MTLLLDSKTLKIHLLTLGPVATNCYIIGDAETSACIVIDPADRAEEIMAVIVAERWLLREIWITHAHFDHILALGALKAPPGVPARMHPADLPILEALPRSMKAYFGRDADPAPRPEIRLTHGDVIPFGNGQFEVRHTPGHAPGHVIFVHPATKSVFSGDCVFINSIGRTDLPGADYPTLMQAITDQILTLPDDYTLYPGHGGTTTVGRERAENPFITEWLHG